MADADVKSINRALVRIQAPFTQRSSKVPLSRTNFDEQVPVGTSMRHVAVEELEKTELVVVVVQNNRRTDRPTDTLSFRDARTHLKRH